ncbi:thiol:disulfide interchange protein DsbD [Nitratiruptor sp. YY08-26]|uniref:protein-disulfide reductase DsbD n=1 Tax=unclassified Nitratiruptor TaxID=2624044 RepID=UPI0019158FAB|nr:MULTISPECIES: protein-disulfide reductase DsbD [unclassified Nitratiruptor]BCD61999.1 thiol:disulfide interchange protein DsbD [Nitratiruptor sp. YY08-13]BCD65935.1 thiol:disulfide interchange protein DsbD [Nitratiruptor sp. YY08-26]
MRWIIAILLICFNLFGFGFVQQGSVDIVPVEKAYKPSVAFHNGILEVNITMAPKTYLYKKEIKLFINGKKVDLKLPPAQKLHGEEVYQKQLNFTVDVPKSGKQKVVLEYQGCNEVGICYPPQKKVYEFVQKSEKVQRTSKPKLSEEESIAATLKHESLGIVLLTFFGFGLLLALTPCVFPMIPILSSLIVGAKNMNAKKAFFYSLVYVLAMSMTYTVAGVLAGLFGANLQSTLQNPVVITLFALIFVALAMSMFGFYEIGLPASWQTKLTKTSDEAGSKGGIIGVAIMGFLSALIVGPCVAPPLAGALIYIGQTGDAVLGGLALFAMSLGMGMPLLLIGTGAGKFMPKPGGWMEAVSKVFGVVMLGVAIWMLDRILPAQVTMLLWAALFIGSAVYLRALEGIEPGAHWFIYFKKSVGIIIFIYGVILMIGAFSGATSLIKPLANLSSSKPLQNIEKKELFQEVKEYQEFEKIVKSTKKPVLLDITAKWCASCKELEHNTFSDPKVQQKMEQFLTLRLDVTDNSPSDKEFLKKFGLYGPPAILFFDSNGKEKRGLRIIGYKSPEEFLQILDQALKDDR